MAGSFRFRSHEINWRDKLSDAPALVELGFTQGWEFDPGTSKKILTTFVSPRHLNQDLGDITLVMCAWVSSTGDAAQSVDMRIQAKYIDPTSELVTKANDESTIDVNIPITNTLGRVHVATFTLDVSLIDPEELITLQMERLTDTYTGKVAVCPIGIIVVRESV